MNASKGLQAEIIVVDNNSTDGSKEYFADRFSTVKFIWVATNLGFGRANNLALQEARGDYILFLNPDTIVAEDVLEKCIANFSSDQTVGAMGVKMIDGSGKYLKESKRGFPAPLTSLYKITGLATLFPTSPTFARYYLGHTADTQTQEVDVLAGAFLMVRKFLVVQLGGFDESFFMYGEDVDLSFRLQQTGHKNLYLADASIIHFKGESTRIGSLNYVKLFYGAMSLFVKKHYRGGSATFYYGLMQAAIWFKALLSGLGHFSLKLLPSSPPVRPAYIILACDGEHFQSVKNLLSHQEPHVHVVGRVNCSDAPDRDSLGKLENLREILTTNQANEIIFCNHALSIKQIIKVMQQIGPGVHYRFHLVGSLSIVGSNGHLAAGKTG